MKSLIDTMLAEYEISNGKDFENALKQVAQHLTLAALSRGKFFEHAAFYGGTALRMLYGLNRFSEDLDFSLMQPDHTFDLEPFIKVVQQDLSAFGLKVDVRAREKVQESAIKSAFIKGGTLENLLLMEAHKPVVSHFPSSQQFKIKFEIDTHPPPGANFQMDYLLKPSPFTVRAYDKPSLFAGKLHAVLCRAWKSRIKGRDFYDLIWYLAQGVHCNLTHLQARMIQSGHIQQDRVLDREMLIELLKQRFVEIDWQKAKTDVLPFIQDPASLDLWSSDFFCRIVEDLDAY